MLDHPLLDVIGAVRRSFEGGFLQRQSPEEPFQIDVLGGDVTWETSYSLPGERRPAHVRGEVSLVWPTWSQSAYRSWLIGEATDDPAEVGVELTLRLRNLASVPDVVALVAALPTSAPLGNETLEQRAARLEQSFHQGKVVTIELEIPFEGIFRLDDDALEDTDVLDKQWAPLGPWLASALVRLGESGLQFESP